MNTVITADPARPAEPGPEPYRRWAADTWRCLDALTDPDTGLPADHLDADLDPATRSGYTSPTNIGGYLWSAVVAQALGLISRDDLVRRLRRTLQTVRTIARHEPTGQLYNWYAENDASVITRWTDGSPVRPFCSSVDNGWLGAALRVVAGSVPEVADLAAELFGRMRWDAYLDPDAGRPGGLVRGGFYDAAPPPAVATVPASSGNKTGAGTGATSGLWLTEHHYDTIVSETRMTTYLGIITGQFPAAQYYAPFRTFPADHDPPPRVAADGPVRHYAGVDVVEGAQPYRGMCIVPGWGGSMFEELMPDLFVPEAAWAPRSWGVNHPLHVRAQREHGLLEAGYGFWGFSPSSNPAGGYREYGVPALGMAPQPYRSDGVVTPHASFLALAHEPAQATANLVALAEEFDVYGPGGFLDAVDVRSGRVARRYLALDQAMIMAALGNLLCDDLVRRAFVGDDAEPALRHLIGQEEFGATAGG